MSAQGDQLRAAAAALEAASLVPWEAGMYDVIWSTTAMMRASAREIDKVVVPLGILGITIAL